MKLYLVPTPIGNLKDITFRAIEVLKEADLILAEDTRTSGKLLKHFEISTHMQSHHMHNEHKTVNNLIEKLNNNTALLVSVYIILSFVAAFIIDKIFISFSLHELNLSDETPLMILIACFLCSSVSAEIKSAMLSAFNKFIFPF